MSQLDVTLQELRDGWHATARYRVIRNDGPGKPDRVIAQGLTWNEARARCDQEDAAIEAEPGYRPVMSRAVAYAQLETAETATAPKATGTPAKQRMVKYRAKLRLRRDLERARENGVDVEAVIEAWRNADRSYGGAG